MASLASYLPARRRHTFEQMRHHFDHNQNTPIDLHELSAEEREGVIIHDVTYASPELGRWKFAAGDSGSKVSLKHEVEESAQPSAAISNKNVSARCLLWNNWGTTD